MTDLQMEARPAPAPSSAPLLEVSGLQKHFPVRKGVFQRKVGSVKAVDGLDFTVGRGETLSLVGESGCGKTTAGRSILRLIEPTGGRAIYRPDGGAEVDLFSLGASEMRRYRRDLQIIFQDPYASLDPRQTVASILAEPLKIHRLAKPRERRLRAMQLLDAVGLVPPMMRGTDGGTNEQYDMKSSLEKFDFD